MNSEEMTTQRRAYCKALYDRWRILDFRGIMHTQMNRAISMPLEDVFVLPYVLPGSSPANYETPQHRQDNDHLTNTSLSQDDLSPGEEQPLAADREETTYVDTDDTVQQQDLVNVLTQQKQLVILGHPGAGKTTLLRYLLLQLIHENEGRTTSLEPISNVASFVPLYIPLMTYAEIYRSSKTPFLKLDDFFPLYLEHMYLDEYTHFLRQQLAHRQVMLLLDGLDELDSDIRDKLVVELKRFAGNYKGNYFIVTSRIVGYNNALSRESDYQEYTLANFSMQQIREFTKQWYITYERWVKGVADNQLIQEHAQKESEKLFQAVERNKGVRGLAINPLLLTILALIQRQGIVLPSHRVELFDLCVTTLIDTWLTAKGYAESSRLSKNELIKLLRPLAFMMHEKGTSNTIEGKLLFKYIEQHFQRRNIWRNAPEIPKGAKQIVDMISGQTGIFVERGPQLYGFLHQTFEEYFAACDLVVRGDRKAFIRQHLHQPRWREVILLTAGVIGILHNDERGVTHLIQNAILQASSPYEYWLQRDLLFAGSYLADDVAIAADCKDAILEQIVYLYLTTPYVSLRKEYLAVLSTWKGTRIAEDTEMLIIPLFEKLVQYTDIADLAVALSEHSYFGQKILDHYRHLSQHYQDAQLNVLRLQAMTILQPLDADQGGNISHAFSLLSNSSHLIRQIAVTSLARAGIKDHEKLYFLLLMVFDPHPEVRQASVLALQHLDPHNPLVLDALFSALSDPVFDVRAAAAKTLGKLGTLEPPSTTDPRILDGLLQALFDPYDVVQKTAAIALGDLGSSDPRIINQLLSIVSASNIALFVREAAVIALGRLGSDRPDVIAALLAILSDEKAATSLREAAAIALQDLQADKENSFTLAILLPLLADSGLDLSVRQAVATTLGSLTAGRRDIMELLLERLGPTTPADLYCVTITALGYMGIAEPHVIRVLFSALAHPDSTVKQEAISAFERLDVHEQGVFEALRDLLPDLSVDLSVREAAATALGNLLRRHAADALIRFPIEDVLIIAAWMDADWQVRRAAVIALSKLSSKQSRFISILPRLLTDPYASVREHVVTLLGRVGADRPDIINKLLECLSKDTDPFVRMAIVKALGHAQVERSSIFHALLMILADLDTDLLLREETMHALTALCEHHTPSREMLRSIISNTSNSLNLIDTPVRQTTDIYNQELIKGALLRSLELLGCIGSNQPRVIDLLMTILSHNSSAIYNDSSIRKMTIRVFAELDMDDPRISDTLLSILLDQGAPLEVKREAISALGQIGRTQRYALQTMINALSDENTLDKRSIVQALGESSSPGSNDVIAALLNLLRRTESGASQVAANAPDRQAAVMALGRIGYENIAVVAALLPLLHQPGDPDLSIRQTAARALGHIGHRNPDVTHALLHVLGYPDPTDQDSSPDVRREAAYALARIGHSQPGVINGLLQIYRHTLSDQLVRPAVLYALIQVGSNDAYVSQILVQALSDSDPVVKRDIAAALSQVNQCDPLVIKTLSQNLFDPEPSVKKKVATTLGAICRQEEHVHKVLLDALSDPDPSMRKEVAAALGNMSDTPPRELGRIRKALLDTLSDPDLLVRREAAFALIRYGSHQNGTHQIPEPLVLNTAFGFLFASDASIRLRAVAALGQPANNQPHVVRALLRALSDDDQRVRKEAASALVRIHAPEMDIAELLSQQLQRYEPIANQKMSTEDADTIDATLIALRQVVGGHQ